VILVFGRFVSAVALPAIAGLLIVVGFRTLKPAQVEMVWKTGMVQQAVMVVTFLFCLLIPLQYAVLVGVALSVLLFVIQQSNQVTVKAWQWEPGELPIEHDAPEVVPPNEVTLLQHYGSVFFATAPLIEKELPDVTDDTHNAVVVLGLRGVEDLGSTFLRILERYALDLREHNSRLMLAGVGPLTKDQLDKTKIAQTIGRENIFLRTDTIGEAATQAWDAAHKWLAEQEPLEKPVEPLESDLTDPPVRQPIGARVGTIGKSMAEAWHNRQQWFAEQGDDKDD
jgi:SulP family sulfate permease